MTTYMLSVDGYRVGDRLLEGVYFNVEVSEDDGVWTVGEVTPAPEAKPYLANIKWENFVPALRAEVQSNLDHTLNWAAENNTTLEVEMRKFEEQFGEPGIQLLMEV